jgi:hypothetical protein
MFLAFSPYFDIFSSGRQAGRQIKEDTMDGNGNRMIVGPGPYQRQDAKSEIGQPLVAAALYVALFLFVWLPAVYVLAVLADWLLSPLLCGTALAMLLKASGGRGSLALSLRPATPTRRIIGGLLFFFGALPLYLRLIGAWGWTFEIARGATVSRLWIGTPWGGTSVSAAWEFLRWALVVVLPVALLTSGRELGGRFLTEIAAPNLPNSIRAIAGRLRDQRRIDYPDSPPAEVEILASPPRPNWEGGAQQ